MVRCVAVIGLAVLVLLLVTVLVLRHQLRTARECLSKAEEDREAAMGYAKRLEARVALLEGEIRIKQEVRGETDKRVDEMLSGDALGNAIDVLHKR